MVNLYVMIVIAQALYLTGVDSFTIANETALRNELFKVKAYDVNVRPLRHVVVSVMFNLITINELNIRDQTFTVSGWFTIRWQDKRLQWNGTEFENVKFIFASQAEVWRPALLISNSVSNFEVIEDMFTLFRINSKGVVTWEPPGIYHVNCPADITFYPFDEQECQILLQSWGYNIIEVNLTALHRGIDLQEFNKNGEWYLMSSRINHQDNTDAKGDRFGRMGFLFKMRRKSQYYWLNVLLPVIVNSILTALVFALPAESGEKMGYSLTVLLSFAVLLTLISDKIPSTSITTSLIVVYFSIVLIMGGVAVMLSTFVLDLYFNESSQPIPDWAMFLFKRILGRLVCYSRHRSNSVQDIRYALGNEEKRGQKKIPNRQESITVNRELHQKESLQQSDIQNRNDDLTWRDIAMILDLFFFRLYLVIIIMVTAGFLTAASNHIGY